MIRPSAVSLVVRDDRVLCVWHKRYQGWTLPGGKAEEGESIEDAQARELREETGLETVSREHIFEFKSAVSTRQVHVFRVVASGEPREVEAGCPVAWLLLDELLTQSPFADFYRRAFAKISLPSREAR